MLFRRRLSISGRGEDMNRYRVVIYLPVPNDEGGQQHYTFDIPGKCVCDVHNQIIRNPWFIDEKPDGMSVAIQVSHITDMTIRLVTE